MASLEQYNDWRKRLIDLIDKTVVETRSISPEKAEIYEMLGKQLREDTLKIQVVGTVKTGKSSFTNALIGAEILPMDDVPCTAISSEVKFGTEKKATVSFYSPLPTGLLGEIPQDTADYLKSNNLGKDADGNDVEILPMEVQYDRMNDYVAIPEAPLEIMMDQDKYNQFKERIAKETPFDVAKLFFPAQILQDGVELVDTPGLNEHKKRDEVTLEYLKKADAAIYLLDATTPVTMEEKRVIEKVLLPLGFKDLIMVANKIDLVRNKEKVRLFMVANTQEYTTQKDVHCVSAKSYLDGIKIGDSDMVSKSGIPDLRKFMIDFLTHKKGNLKIKKNANQIINSLKGDFLEGLIPSRLAALESDAVTLRERVNEAQPKLVAIKARRDTMALEFDRTIPLALVPVKEAVTEYFQKLQNKLSDWIGGYVPVHDCGLFATKSDLEIISTEIIEFAKKKVEEDFNKWNKTTLQPILEEQCKLVFGQVDDNMKGMAVDIARIQNLLNGASNAEVTSTNVMERMAGIAAMAFLPMGRTGGDIFAGGFDLGRALKNFAVDLGVGLGVGLVALWVWPPLGFIAAVAGAIYGIITGTEERIKKLKEELVNEINNGIKSDAPTRVSKILADIRSMFNDIKTSLLEGVDSEISTVKGQLDEILRITTEDQKEIDVKKQHLHELEKDLNEVVDAMSKLTEEVDECK